MRTKRLENAFHNQKKKTKKKRLTPNGLTRTVTGGPGTKAPARARVWYTAQKMPDDKPEEEEDNDSDTSPGGHWQYGGGLATPDPTAWSVNEGMAYITARDRHPTSVG